MEGKRGYVILMMMMFVMPAMAQTHSVFYKQYGDWFPKLPPLKVKMDLSLSIQKDASMIPSLSHPGWQLHLTPPNSSKDSDDVQSVVIRKHPVVDSVEAQKAQFRFTRGQESYENVDNLQFIRDEIVFKRMKDRQKVLAPMPNRR